MSVATYASQKSNMLEDYVALRGKFRHNRGKHAEVQNVSLGETKIRFVSGDDAMEVIEAVNKKDIQRWKQIGIA